MAFRAYASIENPRHIAARVAMTPGTFIVTEKVHGANGSFHLGPDGEVRMASRKKFLEPGEKFHNWVAMLAHMRPLIEDLYRRLQAGHAGALHLIVYGEIYGGLWQGRANGAVQREVEYAPTVNFIAFDVCVRYEGEREGEREEFAYLVHEDMVHALVGARIPFVPAQFSGSFEEAMAWCAANVDAPTRIPELHGLELRRLEEGTTMEGFVIKHAEEVPIPDEYGGRAMLKFKHPKFDELAAAPKAAVTAARSEVKLSEDELALDPYLSGSALANRVGSVVSKMNEEERRNLSRVAQEVLKDAWEDVLRDRLLEQRRAEGQAAGSEVGAPPVPRSTTLTARIIQVLRQQRGAVA